MDSNHQFTIALLIVVFATGAVITVSILWLVFRGRMRALDVLRAYAERGEEPPASVIDAVQGQPRPAPAKPQTRGGHLAHAAGSAIFAVGLAGLAWWRISAFGETGGGVGVALLAALFFAASVAARLVGAYYAPDR